MTNVLSLMLAGRSRLAAADPLEWAVRADTRYRERRRIAEMSEAQLRDIGVTRAELLEIFDRG